ncbi:MAG TPA: DsrE family protein [archaeon]|nr:DsrE family protein [archaeon]
MKLGIIIGVNEPEVVWNAFRFGNTALNSNHVVKVFLMNKGVEVEGIRDKKYNVKEQLDTFTKNKGQILACGTCLKSREKEGSKICPISTMRDLLKLVEESDKVLTFG